MTHHRALTPLLAAALGITALAACSTDSTDLLGTWGTTAPGSPSLTFDEGGQVSGTDGCNRLAGSWTQDGTDVSFGGSMASTLMACVGVDTWLSSLHSARIDGDTLVILDQGGQQIGTLTRAGD